MTYEYYRTKNIMEHNTICVFCDLSLCHTRIIIIIYLFLQKDSKQVRIGAHEFTIYNNITIIMRIYINPIST